MSLETKALFALLKIDSLFFFFLIQIFFGDCGAFHQLFLVAEGQCAQDRFHLTLPKGELWLWLANKMFRLLLPCLPTPASFT